jgi:hypothetical protein
MDDIEEPYYNILLEAYRITYLKIHGEGDWMADVFGGRVTNLIPNYGDNEYIIYPNGT